MVVVAVAQRIEQRRNRGAAVFDERDTARGLRMTHEPRYLRFFQARFEPLVA